MRTTYFMIAGILTFALNGVAADVTADSCAHGEARCTARAVDYFSHNPQFPDYVYIVGSCSSTFKDAADGAMFKCEHSASAKEGTCELYDCDKYYKLAP